MAPHLVCVLREHDVHVTPCRIPHGLCQLRLKPCGDGLQRGNRDYGSCYSTHVKLVWQVRTVRGWSAKEKLIDLYQSGINKKHRSISP